MPRLNVTRTDWLSKTATSGLARGVFVIGDGLEATWWAEALKGLVGNHQIKFRWEGRPFALMDNFEVGFEEECAVIFGGAVYLVEDGEEDLRDTDNAFWEKQWPELDFSDSLTSSIASTNNPPGVRASGITFGEEEWTTNR